MKLISGLSLSDRIGGGGGLPPVFIFRYWDTAGMMWWFLMRCRAEPGCCQSHREKEWLRESKVATWCSGNQFCLSFSVPLINFLLLPHNWITKSGLLLFSQETPAMFWIQFVWVSFWNAVHMNVCSSWIAWKKVATGKLPSCWAATANQHSNF